MSLRDAHGIARRRARPLPLALGVALLAALPAAAQAPAPPRPSLLLITLDTTRADALSAERTPHLEALALAGTRYRRALSPAPLTLPAHASLLTGLDPHEHGVRGNGGTALPGDLDTLATVLAEAGYATAAFVGSRVLDSRFGLARGFARYDDRMAAHALGSSGEPERDARAVTTAALAWLARQEGTAPFFLWVHYYDPHAPYEPHPAGAAPDATARTRYEGELAFVDDALGALLDAVARRAPPVVVAAVGDHGEDLGDHGEPSHGVFLYDTTLHVPLILSGAGVPKGRTISAPAPTRALPATLLCLLGREPPATMGGSLPGLDLDGCAPTDPQLGIYAEATLPASAYGWAPLAAISRGDWRWIEAPRPELYDLGHDPGERRNVLADRPDIAAELRALLARHRAKARTAPAPAAPDMADLEGALAALGYLGGTSPDAASAIDPKDGVGWLAVLERGERLEAAGRAAEARALLEPLAEKNPGNVPLWGAVARARLASGDLAGAIAARRRALALAPTLVVAHLELGHALRAAGALDEARRCYEQALAMDPRSEGAALSLGEIAARAGDAAGEERTLAAAAEAGAESAPIALRLAQIEMGRGDLEGARARLAHAAELAPGWPLIDVVRAELERLSAGRVPPAPAP